MPREQKEKDPFTWIEKADAREERRRQNIRKRLQQVDQKSAEEHEQVGGIFSRRSPRRKG